MSTPTTSPETENIAGSAGALIMGLFLASLGMGFGALVAAFFIFRAQAEVWPPPGTPALPPYLWISTGTILASSVTVQMALRAVRRSELTASRWWLLATLLLALVFLGSQAYNWHLAVGRDLPPNRNIFAVLFYLLTGLHAAHIAGGLVPLLIVNVKAHLGRYTAANHAGLRYCAMYWHFVDVVWVVLFGLLMWGG